MAGIKTPARRDPRQAQVFATCHTLTRSRERGADVLHKLLRSSLLHCSLVSAQDLTEALRDHCLGNVESLMAFHQPDAQYGDRPAAMIRSTAASVLGKATGVQPSDAVASDSAQADDPEDSSGALLYGRASATEDAHFAKAIKDRKKKGQTESASSGPRFTFKTGVSLTGVELYIVLTTCVAQVSRTWSPIYTTGNILRLRIGV